jgi:hypothetical protein
MKTAKVIDFEEGDFTPEFYMALENFFDDDNRINGYQSITIETITKPEEFDSNYLLIQKELVEKGYTKDDLILVDNTW